MLSHFMTREDLLEKAIHTSAQLQPNLLRMSCSLTPEHCQANVMNTKQTMIRKVKELLFCMRKHAPVLASRKLLNILFISCLLPAAVVGCSDEECALASSVTESSTCLTFFFGSMIKKERRQVATRKPRLSHNGSHGPYSSINLEATMVAMRRGPSERAMMKEKTEGLDSID